MPWLSVHISWWLLTYRSISLHTKKRVIHNLLVMTYLAIGFSFQFPSQTHILSVLPTLLSYKRFSWLSGSHLKFVLINESTSSQTGLYFAGNRCFHRVISCSKNCFSVVSVIITSSRWLLASHLSWVSVWNWILHGQFEVILRLCVCLTSYDNVSILHFVFASIETRLSLKLI